jgi:hypothetical protein
MVEIRWSYPVIVGGFFVVLCWFLQPTWNEGRKVMEGNSAEGGAGERGGGARGAARGRGPGGGGAGAGPGRAHRYRPARRAF